MIVPLLCCNTSVKTPIGKEKSQKSYGFVVQKFRFRCNRPESE